MKIWLLNASEQLAFTGSKRRRMRTGLLARALIVRGHDVTWWKSTFEHVSKSHYRKADGFEQVESGLTIGWIHTQGYRGHVSLKRFFDHLQIGAKFGSLANKRRAPDIIVCSFPIPDICLAGVHYGRKKDIPVVVDVRDWWPDAFVFNLNRRLRYLANFAFSPYRSVIGSAFTRATAITGITEPFVDWGVTKAGRTRSLRDRAFPHGYEVPVLTEREQSTARKYWEGLGVPQDGSSFVVSFIGSLTRTFDFLPIIESVRRLEREGKSIKLVLCGDGDRITQIRKATKALKNVVITGEWVGPGHIRELLKRSSIGIVPLPDRPDFLSTINNKTIEYLSAGVPIIVAPKNSLVSKMVKAEHCGVTCSGNEEEEFSRILGDLVEDPGRLEDMALNAKNLFDRRFVASKVYGEFADYIESFANSLG